MAYLASNGVIIVSDVGGWVQQDHDGSFITQRLVPTSPATNKRSEVFGNVAKIRMLWFAVLNNAAVGTQNRGPSTEDIPHEDIAIGSHRRELLVVRAEAARGERSCGTAEERATRRPWRCNVAGFSLNHAARKRCTKLSSREFIVGESKSSGSTSMS